MIRTIAACLLIGLLTGCGVVSETVSSVQEAVGEDTSTALAEYQEQIEPLASEAQRLDEQYAAVQGENYTTDLKMYRVVSRILPKYGQIIEDIEMVEVDNEDVMAAHRTLIDALEAQQRGMTLILGALETHDYEQVAAANDALSESRRLGRDYLRLIEDIGGA